MYHYVRARFGIRGDAVRHLEQRLVFIYHTVTEKERAALRAGMNDADFCKFCVRKIDEQQNLKRYYDLFLLGYLNV